MSEKLISEKWLRNYLDDYDTKVLEPAALQMLNNFYAALIEAPAVDAVEVEKYDELREAFVDFVCSGIHNPAPWCKNRNEECTNVYGMCVFSNDACRGFNPDGERREEE